ncbi:MAG: hypothetical protein OXI95_03725 [bacterium]|nr:hypothetical protein [bacterium]
MGRINLACAVLLAVSATVTADDSGEFSAMSLCQTAYVEVGDTTAGQSRCDVEIVDPADGPFEAGLRGTAHGLAWIGDGDIVALSELILPNGKLYVLSRRSGTSGIHGMVGADGAYRGLKATCDYSAAASDTSEGSIEIHSRCRFERPDP